MQPVYVTPAVLPAMGLEPIPAPPTPPAELTIEIATTDEALRDHASMLRDGFGMPQDFVDRLVRHQLLHDPSIAPFVGRVDGIPVSCSLLATSGRTAGVYNVATPEAFRGKGYGEALTWAAIAEGARRGCTNSVLQASDAGYPMYRRMGFVDLGRYVQLEGPPPAADLGNRRDPVGHADRGGVAQHKTSRDPEGDIAAPIRAHPRCVDGHVPRRQQRCFVRVPRIERHSIVVDGRIRIGSECQLGELLIGDVEIADIGIDGVRHGPTIPLRRSLVTS